MCSFVFMATRSFSLFFMFPMFICAPRTRAIALVDNSKLNSARLGKTASKAQKKEQRERQSGREQKQKSVWERVIGHSFSLSLWFDRGGGGVLFF